MTATLPDDLEEYVQAKVQSGEYSSIIEVIRTGLYLMEDQDTLHQDTLHQDTLHQVRLERLRKEIAIGLEAAARGEIAPLDVEDIIAQGKPRLTSYDNGEN